MVLAYIPSNCDHYNRLIKWPWTNKATWGDDDDDMEFFFFESTPAVDFLFAFLEIKVEGGGRIFNSEWIVQLPSFLSSL